jgi:hypothetical protein
MSQNLMNDCSISGWTTSFILNSYRDGRIISSYDIEKFISNFPVEKKIKLDNNGTHFDSETYLDVFFFNLFVHSYINNWSDYLNAFRNNNIVLNDWFHAFDNSFKNVEFSKMKNTKSFSVTE